MADIISVIQVDRDAVQAFHQAQLVKLMQAVKNKTAGGLLGEDEGDAGNLVQAFARHRMLAEELPRLGTAMQGERPVALVIDRLEAEHARITAVPGFDQWRATWLTSLLADVRAIAGAALSDSRESRS